MALERIGLTDIKKGYEMYKAPYFALFDISGKDKAGNLIFSYTGNDPEQEGWGLLEENLKAAEQSGPEVPYILRFYTDLDKKGSITEGTPAAGCFKVRMQSYVSRSVAGVPGAGGGADLLRELFTVQMARMEDKWENKFQEQERLHQEEIEELEEELQEKNKTKKDMGALGAIGDFGDQYPWAQDLIKDGMGFIKDQLRDFLTVAKHKMRSNTAEPAIGKIPGTMNSSTQTQTPQQTLHAALQHLINYNVNRFGWPEGTTEEQKQAASAEEKDAAGKRGYALFAETLTMLCNITADDDIYDLAINKLKKL